MSTNLLRKIAKVFDEAETKDTATLGAELAGIYASPEMAAPPIGQVADFFITQTVANCPDALRQTVTELANAAEHSGIANGYHNPSHTFQVMINAMALVQINQHRALSNLPGAHHLSDREVMTLLIASIAHDLDHDGKTNKMADSTRIPFRLEEIAVAHADAVMQKVGVPKSFRDDVAAIIYTTDIGEPNGLKAIAKQLAETGAVAMEEIPRQLQYLAANPRLVPLAQILCDADLLSSAGLTVDALLRANAALGKEWGRTLTAEHSLGLFKFVVGDSFQSASGRFFNPNLAIIRQSVAEAPAGPIGLARPVATSLQIPANR